MTTSLTTATEAPTPSGFAALNLSEPVLRAIEEVGYTEPTPVQAATYPVAITGRDIIVQARTGTGKTAAFGIPLVDKLVTRDPWVQALVLAPTRELAVQSQRELARLAQYKGLHTVAIYGGAPMGRQIDELKSGSQLVSGTPGRVLDHLRRGTFDPSHLKVLVLDEMDEMLSMGFAKELNAILELIPPRGRRQTMCFSATVDGEVRRHAERHMHEPEMISLSSDAVSASSITHHVYMVSGRDRIGDLVRVLEVEDPESAIIFCNMRSETERVAMGLKQAGFNADWLNGDLPQRDRERIMASTREGKLRYLVATDVAARGIDISHLTHVINFTFPESAAVYVHRTGRTGRAGRTGCAISLVGPEELGRLYYLRLEYKISPIERSLPTHGELKTRQEIDRIGLLEAAFSDRPNPNDIALARRLLTHPENERILAGLLHTFFGTKEDVDDEAAAARRSKQGPDLDQAARAAQEQERVRERGRERDRGRDVRVRDREPARDRDRDRDRDQDRGRRDRDREHSARDREPGRNLDRDAAARSPRDVGRQAGAGAEREPKRDHNRDRDRDRSAVERGRSTGREREGTPAQLDGEYGAADRDPARGSYAPTEGVDEQQGALNLGGDVSAESRSGERGREQGRRDRDVRRSGREGARGERGGRESRERREPGRDGDQSAQARERAPRDNEPTGRGRERDARPAEAGTDTGSAGRESRRERSPEGERAVGSESRRDRERPRERDRERPRNGASDRNGMGAQDATRAEAETDGELLSTADSAEPRSASRDRDRDRDRDRAPGRSAERERGKRAGRDATADAADGGEGPSPDAEGLEAADAAGAGHAGRSSSSRRRRRGRDRNKSDVAPLAAADENQDKDSEDASGERAPAQKRPRRADTATPLTAVDGELFPMQANGAEEPSSEPTEPLEGLLYLNLGKRDGVRPPEVVRLLRDNCELSSGQIGRVRVRDRYTFVDVPEGRLDGIIEALSGQVLRDKPLAPERAKTAKT